MAIFVDQDTKLIVQGITGRAGTFYTDLAIDYGTRVVGGVRPGKGGSRHIGVPVFDGVNDAMRETGANASLVFVPAPQAGAAMIEAIEAGVPILICVTERVPTLDMVRVRQALKGSRTKLIGPNSQGVLSPGKCKVGVMSTADAKPGRIGVVSRSASLTSEIVAQTSAAGLGQSTTVGIGADPLHGAGFVDCLELFIDDDETEGVILIGEIGGNEEEMAAEYLGRTGSTKPVVALIAGRHAPPERRMGHAGALTVLGQGQAQAKAEALRAAGAYVAENADLVAETMRRALQERAA